eukprot:COSAG02_NODE_51338_length_314_cov_2.367442_2_plen_55_part_01
MDAQSQFGALDAECGQGEEVSFDMAPFPWTAVRETTATKVAFPQQPGSVFRAVVH